MISNNEQSNKEIKQLIILGNGFDLACGLKSSYSDFLNIGLNNYLDKILLMNIIQKILNARLWKTLKNL